MKLKHITAIGTTFFSLWLGISVAAAKNTVGAVYTMTNDNDDNEIVIFDRDANGQLTLVGLTSTGGLGSAGGLDELGSQGSLVLTQDQRWLLAVNADSDDISVFRVLPDSNGLEFVNTFDAGGTFPVSLTIFHDLVYVLNAHSSEITGFYLTHTGELTPIVDSTRELGAGDFAQVGFDAKGRNLIVTQRSSTSIFVYSVDKDGVPSTDAEISMLGGIAPFGFIFDRHGHLLVSEAGSAAVTSYDILANDELQVISQSVANDQAATCWIAGTRQYAFTANTGSNTIASYEISLGDGSLTLLEAIAAGPAHLNLPIDLATTPDGRFLYVLNPGNGAVVMFRIKPDGSLVNPQSFDGGGDINIFAQGIAVR